MSRAPHQRSGGPDLPEVSITSPNLREVLAQAKEIGPAVQRSLRRDLRKVGDDIIAEQRSILSGAKPGNAKKSGIRIKRVAGTNGRRSYLRKVNTYKAAAAGRDRSTGMREKVKASLKTRVVAGTKRSGISVRAEKSIGGVMVKGWNKKMLRHPVFGSRETFVTQFGQPYWWEPIKRGQSDARQKALDAIDNALNGRVSP